MVWRLLARNVWGWHAQKLLAIAGVRAQYVKARIDGGQQAQSANDGLASFSRF
jgi:hypothetical protein